MGKAVVICSHSLAAKAGISVLEEGGNAVDAAIATALTLTVVDPPNCTLTGYGGYMVVKRPADAHAKVITFNTAIPSRYSPATFGKSPRINGFLYGPMSVSVPGVPAGLQKAHETFATLPLTRLCAPAIQVAQDGFTVGQNLQKALSWVKAHQDSTNQAWRNIFAPNGCLLKAGDRLVQRDLAETLQYFSSHASDFYGGSIGREIVGYSQSGGGILEMADMSSMKAEAILADRCEIDGGVIFGPPAKESGFGILKHALLEMASGGTLSEFTTENYLSGLKSAWKTRSTEFTAPKSPVQHTNHFCVADADGTMVACTFTLGPLWFGALTVLEGTGLVLNCGLNLVRQHRITGGFEVINNLTPIVGSDQVGRWYAAGTPGGTRIPAVVLRLFTETAINGRPLQDAMDLPRIAVRPDGTPELEALLEIDEPYEMLGAEDFYGPASIIRRDINNEIECGVDPRFDVGVETL